MRCVIVAPGDLDNLPAEIQTVANVLSAGRLDGAPVPRRRCDARQACWRRWRGRRDLAWFGLHSSADGFDGRAMAWPPAQLGTGCATSTRGLRAELLFQSSTSTPSSGQRIASAGVHDQSRRSG